MPQRNLQVVQRAFDEFNQRDVDSMLAAWADDVEMRPFGGFADLMGGGFKGREGVRHWFAECVGSLHVHAELESIFDAGHRVVVIARTTGIGESSGARVQLRGRQIYSFRDGRISEVADHHDPRDVLRAVGLEE